MTPDRVQVGWHPSLHAVESQPFSACDWNKGGESYRKPFLKSLGQKKANMPSWLCQSSSTNPVHIIPQFLGIAWNWFHPHQTTWWRGSKGKFLNRVEYSDHILPRKEELGCGSLSNASKCTVLFSFFSFSCLFYLGLCTWTFEKILKFFLTNPTHTNRMTHPRGV